MLRTSITSAFRRASPAAFRLYPAPAPAPASLFSQMTPNKAALVPGGWKAFHSAGGPRLKVDKKLEEKLAKKKLEKDPEEVTSTSSIRPVFEQSPGGHKVPDTKESIQNDLDKIVDTVALKTVPKEAHILGLAGTLPYAATSLTTLYLGWDLRQTWAPGAKSIFMFSHENASQLLAFLEPIQLGYGAVIISFLGAIHWGMEFNERSPKKDQTRFRYAMGVVAPAIAWPTIMMPFEYALMSQMTAFTLLYFADTKASTMGWAPAWYGTYRFVLTFVVCTAIVLSLIGRQKISDASPNLLMGDEMRERMHKTGYSERHDPKWERIEKEEVERLKQEEDGARKEAQKIKKD